MDLEGRAEAFARRHKIFSRGSRIVIACSGGPDSLALASVLLALREKWRLALRIAHFEHGIRGSASEADARFVRDFAEANGTPCDIAREDVPAYAKRARLSLETAARERRYVFLETIAHEMGKSALIATGHHAGDQAETVLMHLLRGSGVEGLAGMRPRSGRRARPLLFASRQEILAYLAKKGLTPRWDETNFQADAARNRVRMEILPALRRYNPSVDDALCRLADEEAEIAAFLRASVDAVWERVAAQKGETFFLRRSAYREQPAAVRKAILRRLAGEAGLRQSLWRSHYEALDEFCRRGEAGKALMMPQAHTAECRYGAVILRRAEDMPAAWDETPLALSGATRIDALGLTVHASPWKRGEGLADGMAVVDADALKVPLTVRMRRDGDAFRLENGGRQKVKALLIDRKVPRALRGRVPIFTAGGEIFWVGGLRRAAVALVTDATKRAVAFHMTWDDAGWQEKEAGTDDDG